MTNERKVPVYLCALDWKAVDACLGHMIYEAPLNGKTMWGIGKDRILFIREQIAAALARQPSSAPAEHP